MQPLRMSRRVMNLAYMLTQNARRHGSRPGFVWGTNHGHGARSTRRFPRFGCARHAGHREGRSYPGPFKNGDEMFLSVFAAFRLGAVWVPTNFRLMPDEVTYLAQASGAKAFLCHVDFPEHAKAVSGGALEFTWKRRRQGLVRRTLGG